MFPPTFSLSKWLLWRSFIFGMTREELLSAKRNDSVPDYASMIPKCFKAKKKINKLQNKKIQQGEMEFGY